MRFWRLGGTLIAGDFCKLLDTLHGFFLAFIIETRQKAFHGSQYTPMHIGCSMGQPLPVLPQFIRRNSIVF